MTQLALAATDDRGADISDCGRYRYRLWRRWSDRRLVVWLMLNPSTADAVDNDPTIRRCIGFAQAWGAGGIEVVNLFALRSPSPADLLSATDPVGPGNNDAIAAAGGLSQPVLCAWGSHGPAALRDLIAERAATVAGVLRRRQLWCLGTAKDRSPRHPLYLPADTQPRRYWVPTARPRR